MKFRYVTGKLVQGAVVMQVRLREQRVVCALAVAMFVAACDGTEGSSSVDDTATQTAREGAEGAVVDATASDTPPTTIPQPDIDTPEAEDDSPQEPTEEPTPDPDPGSDEDPTETLTWVEQLCFQGPLLHTPEDFAGSDVGGLFTLSDSTVKANTGAVGDVDGDGRVDFVIGSQIFFNCGDAGFARLEIPTSELPMVSSTLLIDLTGDGVLDIMMGDTAGAVHVLIQRPEGAFEGPQTTQLVEGAFFPALTPLPDGDGDGVVDYIYVSSMTWPFNIVTNGIPDAVDEFERKRKPNVLLKVGAGATFEVVEQDLDVDDCGNSPTFAAHHIPRHHRALPDAFWIANTWAPDCAYSTNELGEPVGPMLMPTDVSMPYTRLNFAMGTDHFLTDEGPVLATSDIASIQVGQPGIQMWRIRDDDMVEQYDGGDPQLLPVFGTPGRTKWGIRFEDFDRDGQRDLICADASGGELLGFNDAGQPDVARSTITRQGGLSFYLGADGAFNRADELMSPSMEGLGWYGTLTGDFFGDDGRGDGCPDVIITSFAIPSQDPAVTDIYFDAPAMVMRNRCETTAGFYGLRGSSAYIGGVVEVTFNNGVTSRQSFRGSSGIGGMSAVTVNFALPDGLAVTSAFIRLPSGEVMPISPSVEGYTGWNTL